MNSAESEFRVSRRARKWNHIADVVHPGEKHEQSFEPDSKAGVRHRSITTQIDIPLVLFRIDVVNAKL